MVTLSGHDTLTNGSYIDAYYRPTMMPQSKPWPGTVRLSLEWFAFFGCQCDYWSITTSTSLEMFPEENLVQLVKLKSKIKFDNKMI